MNSKQTVRIVIEDKATKEIAWYASFDVDKKELNVVAERSFEGMEIGVRTLNADQVVQTNNINVVMIDLAIDLYQAYMETFETPMSGVEWSSLPQVSRDRWITVARRKVTLGLLTNATEQVLISTTPPGLSEFST